MTTSVNSEMVEMETMPIKRYTHIVVCPLIVRKQKVQLVYSRNISGLGGIKVLHL